MVQLVFWRQQYPSNFFHGCKLGMRSSQKAIPQSTSSIFKSDKTCCLFMAQPRTCTHKGIIVRSVAVRINVGTIRCDHIIILLLCQSCYCDLTILAAPLKCNNISFPSWPSWVSPVCSNAFRLITCAFPKIGVPFPQVTRALQRLGIQFLVTQALQYLGMQRLLRSI